MRKLPQVLIITGTPAAGKTTLARALAKRYGYRHIDANLLARQKKLGGRYDRKRMCMIVDTGKLNRYLLSIIKLARKEGIRIVIDSHLSHYLPAKAVDKCIVVTCDLKILKRRLERRRYPKAKIAENLECEIMGICENEARERGHKVRVVDITEQKGKILRCLP
jgi:adenylate kinase